VLTKPTLNGNAKMTDRHKFKSPDVRLLNLDLQLGGKYFTRLVAPNPSLVMHGAHGYSRHEKAPSARKKARKY